CGFCVAEIVGCVDHAGQPIRPGNAPASSSRFENGFGHGRMLRRPSGLENGDGTYESGAPLQHGRAPRKRTRPGQCDRLYASTISAAIRPRADTGMSLLRAHSRIAAVCSRPAPPEELLRVVGTDAAAALTRLRPPTLRACSIQKSNC